MFSITYIAIFQCELFTFGALCGLLLFEAIAYVPLKKMRDRWRFILDINYGEGNHQLYGTHYDKLLGWKGAPETKGFFNRPEFKTCVTLNSKGFRDREHSNLTNTDTYRIVVLGDSMVWGWGVEQKDRFTDRLESFLNNKGVKSEVINLGIPGYGTDQEYLLLQSEGINYKPNLVVLGFCSNDFKDNYSLTMNYWYPKPRFRLTKEGLLRLTNVPVPKRSNTSWILEHSSLYHLYFVFIKRGNFFYHLGKRCGLINEEEGKREAFQVTKELIRKLSNITKQNKSALLVVLMPISIEIKNNQINEELFLLQHFIKSDLNNDVLDLVPLLLQDIGKYYFEEDHHWTPEGHSLVAEAIFNYLTENRFLSQNRGIAK